MASALYFGEVMHRRLFPLRHRFVYRVFTGLFDLDELPQLDRQLWLFSHNRLNLFSFHDRDHGRRDGAPLRPWVEQHLAMAGIDLDGGRIMLLCFPRLLGYVFNPLSVYFCFHRDGELRATLYEVKNTFGDQHGYLLPATGGDGGVRQSCDKAFHVSPFIGMACRYHFRLRAPDTRLALAIRQSTLAPPEGERDVLVATITGRRQPLDDATLLQAWLRHPLMTLKVIAAIHFEALRLWRKGARFHRRTPPPEADVTVVTPPPLKTAA